MKCTVKPRIRWVPGHAWVVATLGQWMRPQHAEKAREWCRARNSAQMVGGAR